MGDALSATADGTGDQSSTSTDDSVTFSGDDLSGSVTVDTDKGASCNFTSGVAPSAGSIDISVEAYR